MVYPHYRYMDRPSILKKCSEKFINFINMGYTDKTISKDDVKNFVEIRRQTDNITQEFIKMSSPCKVEAKVDGCWHEGSALPLNNHNYITLQNSSKKTVLTKHMEYPSPNNSRNYPTLRKIEDHRLITYSLENQKELGWNRVNQHTLGCIWVDSREVGIETTEDEHFFKKATDFNENNFKLVPWTFDRELQVELALNSLIKEGKILKQTPSGLVYYTNLHNFWEFINKNNLIDKDVFKALEYLKKIQDVRDPGVVKLMGEFNRLSGEELQEKTHNLATYSEKSITKDGGVITKKITLKKDFFEKMKKNPILDDDI